MDHIRRLPSEFHIPIEPDEGGYIGRECPNGECRGRYFKITPGTGIQEEAPCHCPYCGHVADHGEFFSGDQIEHALSVIRHTVHDALLKDLRDAFPAKQRLGGGAFSLEITHEVKGHTVQVYRYREKDLETALVCDQCGLKYAVYGVFACCPDCGAHNSLQMLNKSLDVAAKKLGLVSSVDSDLREAITVDALQNSVAAFDAFGRETCRVHARSASAPDRAASLSFQNLTGARTRLQELFRVDLAANVAGDEWEAACISFQKRHLFAHKAGVVDEDYVAKTNDATAVVGRKVDVDAVEVATTIGILRRIGEGMAKELKRASTGEQKNVP